MNNLEFKKILSRFFKENRCFDEKFLSIINRHLICNGKIEYNTIDYLFSWVSSKEGYYYYKLLQLEYSLIILYIYTSNKNMIDEITYNELVRYIQSLESGYNSAITYSDRPNYDKVSLILKNLREFKYDDFNSK